VEVSQLRGFDIILGLRSEDRAIKEAAVKELPRYGATFRLLEYARLLRDRDDGIVESALAGLEATLAGPDEPKLRSVFIADIEAHLWHFTDRPKVLEFLSGRATSADGLSDPAVKQKSDNVRKILKGIAGYNKARGV
jgi:hypothetical protein